jgi:predicted transcriptional regulator
LRSLSVNRRSHLQVVSEILDVCRKPQTKVRILEETGLSMRHLGFCLKYLLKQNLVKLHHRKKTYVTTEEGLRVQQQLPHY